MKSKIFISLLMLTALVTSIHADNIDDQMKKQCQYITYGNGEYLSSANMAMIGIVEGIFYATPTDEKTYHAKNVTSIILRDKACKTALENRGNYGFADDYKWQVLKLVSKRYEKSTL